MKPRDWMHLLAIVLFCIPAGLLAYAAWVGGDVDGFIYSATQTLRGEGSGVLDGVFISAGRFTMNWWWFISMLSLPTSVVLASILAATEPDSSIAVKALWIVSFVFLMLTVPVYCCWQLGAPTSRD